MLKEYLESRLSFFRKLIFFFVIMIFLSNADTNSTCINKSNKAVIVRKSLHCSESFVNELCFFGWLVLFVVVVVWGGECPQYKCLALEDKLNKKSFLVIALDERVLMTNLTFFFSWDFLLSRVLIYLLHML